ncbi:MAG TPA: type II toxin-antitoxin system PemK/MazF family toxin [Acidiferrobacteraceae bacterium]|jgi:mRNA interferase MazF|nr:type II toxin-antitoxin system PemK/MazF family toxin [Acidiferrobacteraceae bacterium]HEX19613.1 type II toxin-antitoxin system PemK/MazF family toxin [Acidiferrobacteraceae bacterium]
MNCKKGEIWWADLDEPRGSEPGYRRPVVIVQSDDFNKSKIKTVIVAIITSNLNLANAPGNIKLGATKNIGLKKESVINVSQVITLDKSYLTEKTGKLNASQRQELNEGLKLVLDI